MLVGSDVRVLSEGYRTRFGMTRVSKDDLALLPRESLSCSSLSLSDGVSLLMSRLSLSLRRCLWNDNDRLNDSIDGQDMRQQQVMCKAIVVRVRSPQSCDAR